MPKEKVFHLSPFPHEMKFHLVNPFVWFLAQGMSPDSYPQQYVAKSLNHEQNKYSSEKRIPNPTRNFDSTQRCTN